MKTEASQTKNSEHVIPPAGPALSPLRLGILLSILAVFSGALVYDWVIAPPRVRAAYDKLQETVQEHHQISLKLNRPNELGGKEPSTSAETTDGLLYREDIQEMIGMAPTKVEKTDLYTIEHYCWWGWIPRNRNFITVLYIGNPDKPHYTAHYGNAMPDDEAIPGRIKDEPPIGSVPKTPKAIAGGRPARAPGMNRPAMAPPGMGPGMAPPVKDSPGMNFPGSSGSTEEEGRRSSNGGKTGGEPKGAAAPVNIEGIPEAARGKAAKKEPAAGR